MVLKPQALQLYSSPPTRDPAHGTCPTAGKALDTLSIRRPVQLCLGAQR